MKIRNKILIYFSSTVIALSACSLFVIYYLFSEYREEEFQQRQKVKIKHTLGLLAEYKESGKSLAQMMDRHTIHDFYDEKMLIFDKYKDLVYESVDDLPIFDYQVILDELSIKRPWIELKDKQGYDIVAVYEENQQNHFYAISKAYDRFGYSKLDYLRNILITIFITTVVTVLSVSIFLSKKISKPIVDLVKVLGMYRLDKQEEELKTVSSTTEINLLIDTFNKLIQRTNETFQFQKHAIHHISHELKTPIAVLVSELERINNSVKDQHLNLQLKGQIGKAKSLGNIINILLEISKIESSGHSLLQEEVRIDEIVFDLIEEVHIIHPEFVFEQQYIPEDIDESRLKVKCNQLLVKQALQNILTNCISYADNATARIDIDCTSPLALVLRFTNTGSTVVQDEERFLFDYFFRGANSYGKSGFGLGLVLTNKILQLHKGSITYYSPAQNLNVFEVRLSLS